MTFDEAMAPLYEYVDGLTDEQRDRIVTAQKWGWEFVSSTDPECRCLVGHAEDWQPNPSSLESTVRVTDSEGFQTFNTFWHVAEEFGYPRVVAHLKLRAASARSSDFTPAPPVAGVGGVR